MINHIENDLAQFTADVKIFRFVQNKKTCRAAFHGGPFPEPFSAQNRLRAGAMRIRGWGHSLLGVDFSA